MLLSIYLHSTTFNNSFLDIYIFGFRVTMNGGTWEEFLTPEDARKTLFISALLMLAMA